MSDKVFGAVLICAVRYCLGRRTYMPELVTDWIMGNCKGKLLLNDIRIMIHDIEAHGARGREAYGDPCDVKTWMGFLEWLKGEARQRS